jgi:hypothetical protein
MNPEPETDIVEFQTWLDQSLRRAWILAFAVAVPGAFCVTLWFPHSAQALLGLAVLGIIIGVVSDAVEQAKKRRVEEIVAIARLFSTLVDVKTDGGVSSAITSGQLTTMLGEIGAAIDRQQSGDRLMVERLNVIHNLLTSVLDRLSTEPRRLQEVPAKGVYPVDLTPSEIHALLHPEFEILAAREARLHAKSALTEFALSEDKNLYAEILLKVDRVAKEMDIPIVSFLGYLNWMTMRSDVFLRIHKQLEEARAKTS